MIELVEITKTYRARSGVINALDGLSLSIENGDFIAVIGRSGSGKSTLMNILGCLDLPTSGEYILNGLYLSSAGVKARAEVRNRSIGFVFQGYNLVPYLTACENVELPLIFRGIPKNQRERAALDALEKVGLSDRSQHRPGELSGGQQQRVAIARAVATKPPLILADEPTGSLDRASARECLSLLRELNRAGHTIILITHDPEAAEYANRRVELIDGRLAL